MAQAIDSPSAQFNSPSTASKVGALTGATVLSPNVAPDDDQGVDRCLQNLDLSHESTVSHIDGCNLECCYCAVRWNARRILLQEEA